jgi:hypothetical protein
MAEKINPNHEEFLKEMIARNDELRRSVEALSKAIVSISKIIAEKSANDAHRMIGEAAEHTANALKALSAANEHHKASLKIDVK